MCVCSQTPHKLCKRTPPNLHGLRRRACKVSSAGQRSPSYRCSGVLLSLPVFFRGEQPYFLIIASSCWLPRKIDATIPRFARFVVGLENRLANHLLCLLPRKQSLRALRCLFPKLNGMSGHSSAFIGLQIPRRKWKSSLSETTPTAKRAHTSRAFAEAPSTMHRSFYANYSI